MNKIYDNGAWALTFLLEVQGIPADPDLILHRSGAKSKMDATDVVRATKQFSVKSDHIKIDKSRIDKLHLPAIFIMNNGEFTIVGNGDGSNYLILHQNDTSPQLIGVEHLNNLWSGEIILVTRRQGVIGRFLKFDFKWFLTSLKKYRVIFAEVLLASAFIQIFALTTPLFFQVIIDKVLVHRGLSTLEVLCIGLVFIALFDTILSGLRTYIFSHTTNRVDAELGSSLFKHLTKIPLAYFNATRVGDTVARVRELETIRQFLTSSALSLVIDLIFSILFISIMYIYSPTLALIVTLTLPLYAVLSILATPIFYTKLEEKFKKYSETQSFLVESVSGIETIKAMAVEPQMQRRWDDQLASYIAASFNVATFGNIITQCTNFISRITTVAILFFGAKLVIANEMSVGQLVAFNMLAGYVSGPIMRIAQIYQDFHQVRISIARLGDILNTPAEQDRTSAEANLPELQGQIDIQNVKFRYRPNLPLVLHDLSLTVKPGEVVGIVGQSGSGKSTIAKLVQRLYVPESGRVLVDGVDLSLIDPSWLRRQVGVVLQENVLFNCSVRDNIALANATMPFETVVKSAKLAGAHDFITAMPNGYDTIIGERGASLSGGQRQRIAIARALSCDPKILIFDEATSALDYESESIIQNNMREIISGRTVLIIAHRLSTIRLADRIITIENGVIIEDGTHDELIAANGRYAHLFHLQNQGQVINE
jgi:ATP-binding cassette, subfamily B, bacterial HlyB/CyaB